MEGTLSNNQLKEAYKTIIKKVVGCMSANGVSDLLFEAGIVSDDHYRELCQASEGLTKARLLMSLLCAAGHPRAFIIFHEAMKNEPAYTFLAEEVEVKCKQTTAGMAADNKPDKTGEFQ